MYGLVNQAIEDLVRTHHGDAAWEAIKRRAGVEIDAFVTMEGYPDEMSYGLVAAASAELGAPAEALLEAFGEHWTLFTAERGYGAMFKMGGSSFKEFMLNLHSLHSKIALGFPRLQPPSFWCTDVTDTSLRLHYQSARQGFTPMLVGLVRGLGRMYQVDVTITPQAAAAGENAVLFITFTPTPHA